jgi:hypothetical protein
MQITTILTQNKRRASVKREPRPTPTMCKLQHLNQSMLSVAGGPSSISAQVQSEGPTRRKANWVKRECHFAPHFEVGASGNIRLEWSNWVTKSSLRCVCKSAMSGSKGGFSLCCKFFFPGIFQFQYRHPI